jgi:hypothetical protein
MVKSKERGPGLWEGMLTETANSRRTPDANLLMLGRPGIGKRSLVNALLAHASPAAGAAAADDDDKVDAHSRATAVDHAYFGVRDPNLNDFEVSSPDFMCKAACSVSILEDARHQNLFMNRIGNLNMRYCAAMICLDMKEPWTMMEDLLKWLNILNQLTSECLERMPEEQQNHLRQRVRDVVEGSVPSADIPRSDNGSPMPEKPPGEAAATEGAAEGIAGATAGVDTAESTAEPAAANDGERDDQGENEGQDAEAKEEDAPTSPLTRGHNRNMTTMTQAIQEVGDTDLAYNLGIPLIVTVTRCDAANALEKQKTIGWSDLIEMNLRQTCLSYGASIVYTMVQAKNLINIDVLYAYLMHRIFNYRFRYEAVALSRDALFIPTGWDHEERLDKVSLEKPFETVVVKPPLVPVLEPKHDDYENMNAFLRRAQASLQKMGGVAAHGHSTKGGSSRVSSRPSLASADMRSPKPPTRLDPSIRINDEKTVVGSGGTHRPAAGAAGNPVDNTSLSNFFQNLLTRGSSPPGKAAAPGPKAS